MGRKSPKQFTQAARTLICFRCKRSMAYAKRKNINGHRQWICRPCRRGRG